MIPREGDRWYLTGSYPAPRRLGSATTALVKRKRTGLTQPVRFILTDAVWLQNLNFRANCICLDDPESPVANRVFVIWPNVALPTTRPG